MALRRRSKYGEAYKDPRIRDLGRVAPEIKFEGDWYKVQRTLDDVPKILLAGAIAGQE